MFDMYKILKMKDRFVITANALLLLIILSVGFFSVPKVSHAACSITVYFQVTDLGGTNFLSVVPDKNTDLLLYAKYTANNCDQNERVSGAHRFAVIGDDGKVIDYIGSQVSYNFSPSSGAGLVHEVKLQWNLSGLKDSSTRDYVQPGGKVKLQAHFALDNGASTDSAPVSITVANVNINSGPGDTTNTGNGSGSNTGSGAGAGSGTTNTGSGANTTTTNGGTNASGLGKQLYNPIESENLGQLMLAIMKGFIIIIAAWSVLFIIVGGFRMVMSQGNSEALTKAKATITWAIAGVIVSILAFSVVAIVQNLVGYKGIPTSKIQSNNRFV